MQYLKLIILVIVLSVSFSSFSQSDFISLNTRQYDLLDRLELKLRKDSVLNFSAVKPLDQEK